METQGSPKEPPLPPSVDAFNELLVGLPRKKKSEASKFVKKLKDIPEISLPPETPIQVALSLAEQGLIG